MESKFLPHNTHLEGADLFIEQDPQLRLLRQQLYVHEPALLSDLPIDVPGIYTLGGGRQIGKTTLLKQWMSRLLGINVNPASIAFFSGELIDDQHSLVRLLQEQLMVMPDNALHYLLLDEVTYIKDWDKGVKYLADAGLLEQTILLLTGSDLVLIQEARTRFPGRRGKANTVDFHLYPLSFREFLVLKDAIPKLDEFIDSEETPPMEVMQHFFDAFKNYLLHGGYLTAINDLAATGTISAATLATYSDWVRGDILKCGKQEHYLREVLGAIIKRYGSQLTWNALARDLSIDHPKTVADYVELLASMDAAFIQPALLEDKLVAAPKKARKLMFTDPFIFHAIYAWLWPENNPFQNQMKKALDNPQHCAQLVEACVVTHYRRYYPTYYIKSEGEVDIAYIDNQRFWPIEIKWGNQLRPKDLKQIGKYPNGRILAKSMQPGMINQIKTEPLPLALARLA